VSILLSIAAVVGGIAMQQVPVGSESHASDDLVEESDRLRRLVGLKERLTYEAHYGFMKLGEAVVEQYQDTVYKGQRRRLLRTVVTSNPKLLFVGYKEERFH